MNRANNKNILIVDNTLDGKIVDPTGRVDGSVIYFDVPEDKYKHAQVDPATGVPYSGALLDVDLGTHLLKAGTAKFGGVSDYTEFEADGTLKMVGLATVYDDLTGDITRTKTVGTRVTVNDAENSVDYTNAATTTDYLYLNYQMSHKWMAGTAIYPHIHFEQANNNTPNFLFYYRWQKNGGAKTTAWTPLKCNTAVFTYVSGTLNQIADGVSIAAPVGYGISDILQFRLCRDTTNASGLFGADPYTGTVSVTSVDCHLQHDTLGSRSEYTK